MKRILFWAHKIYEQQMFSLNSLALDDICQAEWQYCCWLRLFCQAQVTLAQWFMCKSYLCIALSSHTLKTMLLSCCMFWNVCVCVWRANSIYILYQPKTACTQLKSHTYMYVRNAQKTLWMRAQVKGFHFYLYEIKHLKYCINICKLKRTRRQRSAVPCRQILWLIIKYLMCTECARYTRDSQF